MKKVAGVGLCLIAVGVVWYLFQGSAQELPVQTDKTVQWQSKKVVSAEKEKPDIVISDDKDVPKTDEVTELTNTEKMQACIENYQKKPEWKEIESILSGIYQNGEEAAGQGTFQQMPIESLSAFADAGDKDAMFHYGNALMWKGAIGIFLNYQGKLESLSDPQGYREKPKKHKPDLQLFKHGAEYSYHAAVKGRYGGIMEIGYMNQMMLNKMVKHDYPEPQQIKVFADAIAHLKLLQFIHQKDKPLIGIIDLDSYTEKLFERIFRESDDQKDIKKKTDDQADKKYQQLEHRWSEDRAFYGLEEAPDLMSPHLEQFYEEEVEVCVPKNQG